MRDLVAKYVTNNFTDSSTALLKRRTNWSLWNSTVYPPINIELPTLPEVSHRLGKIKFKDKPVRNNLHLFSTHQLSGFKGIPALILPECLPDFTPVLTPHFPNSLMKVKYFLIINECMSLTIPLKVWQTCPLSFGSNDEVQIY